MYWPVIKQCYKSVQSFRVTCLFNGQYDTREYGTIAGVILRPDKYNTLAFDFSSYPEGGYVFFALVF